jgi:hypothetical protein
VLKRMLAGSLSCSDEEVEALERAMRERVKRERAN